MSSIALKSTPKNQISTRLRSDVKEKLDLLASLTGQNKTRIAADAVEHYMLRHPAKNSLIRFAQR